MTCESYYVYLNTRIICIIQIILLLLHTKPMPRHKVNTQWHRTSIGCNAFRACFRLSILIPFYHSVSTSPFVIFESTNSRTGRNGKGKTNTQTRRILSVTFIVNVIDIFTYATASTSLLLLEETKSSMLVCVARVFIAQQTIHIP